MNASSPKARAAFAIFWVLCAATACWLYINTLGTYGTIHGTVDSSICSISAGMRGTLRNVSIQVGSSVQAGDEVGRVVLRDLDAWETLSNDRLTWAKTSRTRTARSLRTSWNDTRDTLKENALKARDAWLNASRDLQSHRAELNAARRTLNTLKGDLRAGFGQKNRLEDLRRDVVRLQALVGQDVRRVEALREARLVADQRLKSLEDRGVERWVEDALAKVPNEEIEARSTQLQVRDERRAGTLRAPCSGMITALLHRNESVVSQGSLVARVMPLTPKTATIWTPESDRRTWAVGEKVRLVAGGSWLGSTREETGTIRAVAPGFEPLEDAARTELRLPAPRVRRVYIQLSNETKLKPGERVQAELLEP